MPVTPAKTFDFGKHHADRAEILKLVREFAEAEAFRSATVEELELDDDFYRRPVRPEDLSFIKFDKPPRRNTVTRLPFFAAQRLLMAANELKIARLPRDGSQARVQEAQSFYSDRARSLGERVRPFLEDFSFHFLDEERPTSASLDIGPQLRAHFALWQSFWSDLLPELCATGSLEECLRFALIQYWCLAPSRRHSVSAALAAGFFEAVPPEAAGYLTDGSGMLMKDVAHACGLPKKEHSYWQFYLSTSMAQCNLLHAFAARPGHAFRMVGATLAAEAEWIAFQSFVSEAAVLLGWREAQSNSSPDNASTKLFQRIDATSQAISSRFGNWGLDEMSVGLSAADALSNAARDNLGEQLRWLASVEKYQALAYAIDKKIREEHADIDRETFVERREMCSTTHVHDDHRLVVIESGDMVFWGNLGMKLHLKPGEMVLVPQGRLHGSSIESDECTYHQPIIPDEWIKELTKTQA